MPLGPMPLPQTAVGLPSPEPIRGRTLITLRWVAVAGQLAAVLTAALIGVDLPVTAALGVIVVAAAFNLYQQLKEPARITDARAFQQLTFDIVQLGALLALTGGTSNPFGLLMLAPVTIGATALPHRAATLLLGLTLCLITAIAIVEQPLHFLPDPLIAPQLALRTGNLLALLIGGVFFFTYVARVAKDLSATSNALFATQLALQREQRLQHLGGIVAAAAHEMGTPLATMKLVSAELADEISDALPDRKDLTDDLNLLRTSADRCRDILRSMGAAGKDDLLLHSAPLAEILDEAAAPHRARAGIIDIELGDAGALDVRRDPGVIHGLRNLIQNGIDFARNRVEIRAERVDGLLTLTIRDDGPGYPPTLLSRLGEPFLTARRVGASDHRKGYEGMGLGLFIARTLLERSGARVVMRNDKGARVDVTWPERGIMANSRARLGENPEIDS